MNPYKLARAFALVTCAALNLTGCVTQQRARGYELPPVLSEVFRGGQLKGLETNDGAVLGMPGDYDRVQHVCTSTPMYDLYGRYYRTDVRCW